MRLSLTSAFLIFHGFYLVVCFCFFVGFFPVTLPNLGAKPPNGLRFADTRNHVNKSIIIIIDALRYDFVSKMPNMMGLIKSGEACVVPIEVNTPTVTMPRLKSIISGTVPSFVDVIFNLGSPKMTLDNIIHQLKKKGINIIFYGDHIWIEMFDEAVFLRAGPNKDSFFVNDFYEGDKNITEKAMKELAKKDWGLMLLHFLGLDHIGHVLGAKHKKINEKLLEMDDFIVKIRQNSDAVIFVTGDHGMREAGGHGGNSKPETEVPLIMVGLKNCRSSSKMYSQVDIAPTLALLLGISVPEHSVGSLIPQLFPMINIEKLQRHIADKLLEKIKVVTRSWKTLDFYVEYAEAIKFNSSNLLDSSSTKMRDFLIKSAVTYDIGTVIQSIISSFLILLTVAGILAIQSSSILLDVTKKFFLQIFLGSLVIYYLTQASFSICLALCTIDWVCICFMRNYLKVSDVYKKTISFFRNSSKSLQTLLSLVILQSLSFASSSFIEEEHQLWYYICNTFFIIFSANKLRRAKESSIPKLTNAIKVVMFFGLHLLCRRLNQTGDKWINLPDIHDWLTVEGNEGWNFLLFVFGILLTSLASKKAFTQSTVDDTWLVVQSVILLLYKVKQEFRNVPFLCTQDLIIIFWVMQVLFSIASWVKSSKSTAISIFITTTTLMLQKPHNAVLCGANILTCLTFTHSKSPILLTLLHICVGKLFFFYQGNSNSLATIDLAAGYVGSNTFSFVKVGLLVTLNTYTGHILAFLMLATVTKDNFQIVAIHFALFNMFQTSIYLVIVTIFRYHLFIWSVFSPKILYDFYFMVLSFIFLIFGLICY